MTTCPVQRWRGGKKISHLSKFILELEIPRDGGVNHMEENAAARKPFTLSDLPKNWDYPPQISLTLYIVLCSEQPLRALR